MKVTVLSFCCYRHYITSTLYGTTLDVDILYLHGSKLTNAEGTLPYLTIQTTTTCQFKATCVHEALQRLYNRDMAVNIISTQKVGLRHL
jgi:hypothetical protein